MYPDSQYEFGQIGIGTCIAGPNNLRFMGEGEDTRLLVTNANPYLTFDGGSLFSIPGTTSTSGTVPTRSIPSAQDDGSARLWHRSRCSDDLGFIALSESDEARAQSLRRRRHARRPLRPFFTAAERAPTARTDHRDGQE